MSVRALLERAEAHARALVEARGAVPVVAIERVS